MGQVFHNAQQTVTVRVIERFCFFSSSLVLTSLFVSFLFAAIPLGLIVVPGDSDLETCRAHIERLQEVKNERAGLTDGVG